MPKFAEMLGYGKVSEGYRSAEGMPCKRFVGGLKARTSGGVRGKGGR